MHQLIFSPISHQPFPHHPFPSIHPQTTFFRIMAKFVALVAVIVAIIVAVSASYSAQHEGVTFESWLLEHPKAYSDAYSNSFNGFEYELRRQIFLTNMKTIRAHNERFEAGLETWWMKPTQFADLTEAEFVKNHLGLAKGTQTNGSSTARRLNSLKATSLQIKDFEPIDWQKAGVMPTAPNQGMYLFSFWWYMIILIGRV